MKKSEMMARMRADRKAAGMREIHFWVPGDQAAAVKVLVREYLDQLAGSAGLAGLVGSAKRPPESIFAREDERNEHE